MANGSYKSFFMPMFCRLSINDTVKPAKSSDSTFTDPSSPKVSCIGQIKKRSNNNNHSLLACRFSSSATAKSSSYTNLNYTKLQKLFSGKNIISPAIDTATINNCSSKCVSKRSNSSNSTRRSPISTNKYYMTSGGDRDLMRVVAAEELDPPLPVVKCRRRDHEVNVNLLKRRGVELKTLQIRPIQLPLDHNSNSNNDRFSLPATATATATTV